MKMINLISICLVFNCLASFGLFAQSDIEKPLFEIKNTNNQTVFAVYQNGVKIFIEDKLKATGGGFTVGRLGTGKAGGEDFFIVNPGDVRVNIPSTLKATGGGFTVGRLGTGKASGDTVNFLSVTQDSTRIFVNDSVAGFAVSNQGNESMERLLNLNKQNYMIGHNTGIGIKTGKYNSLFGYEAGKNIQSGDNNLFLGYQTGYLNSTGNDNVYIGNKSGYRREGGYDNICIGNLAGENSPFATHSTFIGSEAGRNLSGDDNMCIGDRAGTHGYTDYHEVYGTTIVGIDAGRNVTGDYNTIIGTGAGSNWSGGAAGSNNVFIGTNAGGGGGVNKLGDYNVCIGYNAGFSKQGSNKLYISNSDTQNPLIYGEFDTKNVIVTGNLYATGEIASTSDIRLKTNLVKISSGLEFIDKLSGYFFDWNEVAVDKFGYPEKKQIGLIAQDVETVLPELVTVSPNGYKAIDYTKLSPILLTAIKEQQAIINDLKEKNNSLEKKVNELNDLKSEIDGLRLIIQNLQTSNENK